MLTPAMGVQILPYSTLLKCLELQGVRALEDFIIQRCIYSGIIKCKLDQVNSCIHVLSVLQRDVRPEELPALSRGLEEMCAAARLSSIVLLSCCNPASQQLFTALEFRAELVLWSIKTGAVSVWCMQAWGDS